MKHMPGVNSTGDPLSVKVVEAVAEHDETDMVELPPLGESINPDALDSLFESVTDPPDSETQISLDYYGYTVRIDADRSITID